MNQKITQKIKPRHEYAWKPQPGPQTHAFLCPLDEIFIGGSRGGGKSQFTIIGSFLKNIHIGRGWNSIVIRRKGPEHETYIDKTKELYPFIEGNRGKWNGTKTSWTFENGATQRFRHLERDADALNYKGQEYTHVAVEEADGFKDFDPIEKIYMCCRSGNPEIAKKKQIIINANPGGPGHNWLKARFVDFSRYGYRPIVDPVGNVRIFIPANVYDNKILMEADPSYERKLRAIKDPALRAAWLHGNWDVVVGGYFSDRWYENSDKIIISPFKIPTTWPVYCAYDWGCARPFSYGMYTVSPGFEHNGQWLERGALIRFKEIYGILKDPLTGKNVPNKGNGMDDVEIAKKIAKLEWNYRHQIKYRVADPSIWSRDGGKSKVIRMNKATKIRFKRAKNDREAGWALLRYLLQGEEKGRPLFHVFNSCFHFLRTFPGLTRDEKNWDDVDSEQEDHAADEFRYMAMANFKEQARKIQEKIRNGTFEHFNLGAAAHSNILI